MTFGHAATRRECTRGLMCTARLMFNLLPISLNEDSIDAICLLPHVNRTIAAAIISRRPINAWRELQTVKGIKAKIAAKLRRKRLAVLYRDQGNTSSATTQDIPTPASNGGKHVDAASEQKPDIHIKEQTNIESASATTEQQQNCQQDSLPQEAIRDFKAIRVELWQRP